MHTAEIAAQVTAAAQELLQIGAVKAGQEVFVQKTVRFCLNLC